MNSASPAVELQPATVDPHLLGLLNARYQPRFHALWAAAQSALLAMQTPGVTAPLPNVVSPSPGDRRFAASEWSDLPYFSLLKQSYLLTAEYLNELADLAPLPDADKRRLKFMMRQTIDAFAPTNFPSTNPEVIKRALKTNGAS